MSSDHYSYFNHSHWRVVKAARRAQGLAPYEAQAARRHHPLCHVVLTHSPSGETWFVQCVYEDWLLGRYLRANLKNGEGTKEKSIAVQNISCVAPEIIDELTVFNQEFTVSGTTIEIGDDNDLPKK